MWRTQSSKCLANVCEIQKNECNPRFTNTCKYMNIINFIKLCFHYERPHSFIERYPLLRFLSGLCVVLLVAILSYLLLPFHPEEAYTFFPLHCFAPQNLLQIGFPEDEYCRSMSIIIASRSLPFFGNGWHQGILPVLSFLPLYILFPHPFSLRFYFSFLLYLQSFFLGRVFHIRTIFVLLFLLIFYPYALQHLSDTGPIAQHALIIALLYFFLQQWSRDRRLIWIIGSSVCVVAGFYVKVTILWLLPGIAGIYALSIFTHKKDAFSRKIVVRHMMISLLFIVVFSMPSLLIRNSVTHVNRITSIISKTHSTDEQVHQGTHLSLYHLLHSRAVALLFTVLDPPFVFSRSEYVGKQLYYLSYSVLVYLWVPIMCLLLYVFYKIPRNKIIIPAALYVLFLLTISVIGLANGGRLMTHTILSFPFLVLAILSMWTLIKEYAIPRLLYSIPFAAFVSLNGSAFILLLLSSPRIPAQDMLGKISRDSEISQQYIQVVFKGTSLPHSEFFFRSIFGGDRRMVVLLKKVNIKNMEQLDSYARTANRKLLLHLPNISDYNSRLARNLSLRFGRKLHRCQAIPSGSLSQIYLESSPIFPKICVQKNPQRNIVVQDSG